MIAGARIRSLVHARRGAATVEFALWSILIFAALLPCLDFALYLTNAGRLSTAVHQGAMLAYKARDSAIDEGQLIRYVQASSGLQAGTVSATVRCNGGTQSCTAPVATRTCTCITATTPVSYATTSCTATCSSGAKPGFYLTLQASHLHRSLFPDPWLDGRQLSQSTTVRLQ
jgi:Flp pilus assembly protein TadG